MSYRRNPEVRCLPVSEWPSRDRELWRAIISPGSILSDAGSGAHWRAETKLKLERNYGRWLDFLARSHKLESSCPPKKRLTPELAKAYLWELQRDCASRTTLAHVAGLRVVIKAMAPSVDWEWLERVERRLRNTAQPVRDLVSCLQPSDKLFASGLRYMDEAGRRRPHLKLDESSRFRDGLMIALLAARPIRMRNLTMMTLGQHLVRHGERFSFAFTADEHKVKRPLEFQLPEQLTEPMETYLRVHRPLLLQGQSSDRVWISNTGRAMTAPTIACRIKRVTKRLFGRAMNPHAFRHAVATTIAEKDPTHAGIIRSILGHATLESSTRNYNKARAAVATRAFAREISAMRRKAVR